MAGDWLKVEKDTPEKPEVFALAARLGMDPEAVFAKCFKVWRWFDTNTTDGLARGVLTAMLDAYVQRAGFADAMREVGWLEVRDGALAVPNFARHMGKSAKSRALTMTRMKRKRLRSCDAASVTSASPEKEKRREEKKKGEFPLIPPVLATPEFAEAWKKWLAFRAERKPRVTSKAAEMQFKKMVEWGPARAVAAIEFSIRNSYQGIFEESNHAGHRGGVGPDHRASRVEAPPGKYDGRADFFGTTLPADPGDGAAAGRPA